jgi:hydrogenase-1 operon protein HyaF
MTPSAFSLPVLGGQAPKADPFEQLFGMPEPMEARRELKWFDEGPGAAEVGQVLSKVVSALQGYRVGDTTRILSLAGLSPAAMALLEDTLGQGEVTATVQGARRWELAETALVGLWRIKAFEADGTQAGDWLEVAGVPSAITAANQHGTSTELSIGEPPAGTMNSLPVLAELRHRVASFKPGQANHVISFTLLPMNDVDMGYLQQQLGRGPVLAESKGYGRCRLELTAHRNLWSVQFFNAMGTIILDTLEVGEVPSALGASNEDFEDSAMRLSELLEHAS